MAGIAKITLVGNLGRDPETRYTPNGRMNVQFTMAVSRRFNDQSGQQQERTNWYRVTAWGGLAESLDRLAQSGYLAKGKQVYVDGRLEPREYQDQQGQTRTSLDVTANELQLLGSRADSEGSLGGGGYGAAAGAGATAGAGAAAGRSPGQQDPEDGPGSIEEVPWDDGEPPF
jgi:single-strand DNA-binding protein